MNFGMPKKYLRNIWRFQKVFLSFQPKYMLNWTNPDRDRMAEAMAGGSVYQRSQPGRLAEERPGAVVQGRGMESMLS